MRGSLTSEWTRQYPLLLWKHEPPPLTCQTHCRQMKQVHDDIRRALQLSISVPKKQTKRLIRYYYVITHAYDRAGSVFVLSGKKKRRCMQRKRCIISVLHATLFLLKSTTTNGVHLCVSAYKHWPKVKLDASQSIGHRTCSMIMQHSSLPLYPAPPS